MVVQTEYANGGTTIRVTIGTKNRLVELGSKNESYDDIIKRLLDEHDSRLNK